MDRRLGRWLTIAPLTDLCMGWQFTVGPRLYYKYHGYPLGVDPSSIDPAHIVNGKVLWNSTDLAPTPMLFETHDEVTCAHLLLKVQGIGPVTAAAIVGLLTPEQLVLAIWMDDHDTLRCLPRLSRKILTDLCRQGRYWIKPTRWRRGLQHLLPPEMREKPVPIVPAAVRPIVYPLDVSTLLPQVDAVLAEERRRLTEAEVHSLKRRGSWSARSYADYLRSLNDRNVLKKDHRKK